MDCFRKCSPWRGVLLDTTNNPPRCQGESGGSPPPPRKSDSCHIYVLINSRHLNPEDTNSLSAQPTPISTWSRWRWTSEVTFIKTTSSHEIVVTLLAHLRRTFNKNTFLFMCKFVSVLWNEEWVRSHLNNVIKLLSITSSFKIVINVPDIDNAT